ncbi:MAG TPA: hypothetical protein VEF03_12835, partial [Candidatus Binataceae bacterium]|nr:hypothetical protein [Candidatus Binataceae bacterium]
MALFEDVIDFIAHPDPARFESLALAVFRYQFEAIPVYREFCTSVDTGADRIRRIDEIPAVSTLGFKYSSLWAPDAEQ